MKRFLPILLSLALLAGCGQNTAVLSVTAPKGSASTVEGARAAESDGAYSSFGLELLRAGRSEGENTILSPLSVTLALGMTANGAAGNTLAEFEALFGMDLPTLNALCTAMLEEYGALGGSTQADLADSLWLGPDLEPVDAFIARCTETYGAQLYQVDFREAGTVKAANDWVSEQTRGLIHAVVEKFEAETVLALINAVYLKNKFSSPFPEPFREWTLDFTAEDGTVTQPKSMNNGARSEQYISAENGQGVLLPYDDGKLGFLLMLPDEGLSLTEYLAGWDGDTIWDLLAQRKDTQVDLTMPKFKAEWGNSLKDTLAGLGLKDAFTDAADFSALGTAKGGMPLYISDVIHKAVLEVNEKGTEAAAVTIVSMAAGSAAPVQNVVLRFDRPFVYAIVDLSHGTPLFLGTMERA